MAARADLLAAYTECKSNGDEISCEQIADSVTELNAELRAAGVRGRLNPLDPQAQAGQAFHPAPPGCPGPASPTGR